MMTRLTHISCLFGAIGSLIPTTAINGQTKAKPARTISPEDQELIHFLLTSMKKSREKMASGECLANMSYYKKGEQWQLVMTESIHCAFDFPAQNYLIKRIRPHIQGKYISTPQKSFMHTSGLAVTIHHPMEKPGLAFRPFDVRVLGWTTPHEFDMASYEKIFGAFEKAQWDKVEKDGAGIYNIDFHWGNPQQAEHKLWLDSSKDYVPVRFEYGELEPKTGQWNTPKSIVETEWKKYSNGWFPEVVTLTEFHKKGTTQETVTKRIMKFVWKRANRPIDQSLYTLKSWNLPPQTLLVDLRPGEENLINLGPIGSNPE